MRARAVLMSVLLVAALGTAPPPAAADQGAVTFTGIFESSPTWLPVGLCPSIPCPQNHTWKITIQLSGAHGRDIYTNQRYDIGSGSGMFDGWCGSATGSGSIYLPPRGGPGLTANVTWVWWGTTVIVQGTGSGGHTVFGTFELAPIVLGSTANAPGNCVTVGMTEATIAGHFTIV